MDAHAHHFIDLADARVIFRALAQSEPDFNYREYKGTPPQNGRPAVSRVFTVTIKNENVYMELKSGPGRLTDTGAITPAGKPEVEVNVGFKLFEARRNALSVLAYIQAWDVLQIMVNQEMISRPGPYLLVPATSVDNGNRMTPANGILQPKGATRPPIVAVDGRPVTRKDPMPKVRGAGLKQPNNHREIPAAAVSIEQPLKYGNGAVVDANNLTEVQTFQRYVGEKKTAPESKAILLDYHRQRVQKSAASS